MNYAVILASGKGSRAGVDLPKQFVKIGEKTVLEYTLSVFQKNKSTDRIILVVNEEFVDLCQNFKFSKLYKVVRGGKRRQDSSYIGVNLIEEEDANVLIHDGARAFVKDELIERCYKALESYSAVNTGVETSDTIIKINEKNIITDIPKRSTLLRCQTPQGFKASLIKKAHKLAKEKNIEVTDDTGLVVALSLGEVYVVEGDVSNVKITYPEDIELAKRYFLTKRE